MCVMCKGLMRLTLIRSMIMLTFANCCKERFVNLPTVIVNCFCDLIIRNSRIRLSFGDKSYHKDSYAASPIILLWKMKKRNAEEGWRGLK